MSVPGARLPNLIIVGVGGAGTTSLFSYLAQHPDICGSRIKEVKYFTPLKYGQPLAPPEAYAQYFSQCDQEKYLMEATPGYFYGGKALVSSMNETLPGVHVLAILRDPSARVWSSFNYMKIRLRIDKEHGFDDYLETALDLWSQGTDDLGERSPYWPLPSGSYAEYISEWLDTFGPSFRVVFFEDLAKDPRTVVEQLCSWLGIQTGPASELDYSVHNRTVLYKNKSLQKIALAVNDRGERFFRQHPMVKQTLLRIYSRFNRKLEPSQFDPAARRRLDAFYASSNKALATQLASRGYHQLPPWLQRGETS
jgi:hypothetical protein